MVSDLLLQVKLLLLYTVKNNSVHEIKGFNSLHVDDSVFSFSGLLR